MTNSTGSLDVLTIAWSKIKALVGDACEKLEEARKFTIDEQGVRHGFQGPNVELEKLLHDVRIVEGHLNSAIERCKRYRSML